MSRLRTIQVLALIAWLVLITLFFMPTVIATLALALAGGAVGIYRRRVAR